MSTAKRAALAFPLLFALALAGCGGGGGGDDTGAAGPPTAEIKAMFGSMPKVMASADNPITDEKVVLGRALYYDPRMSASGDISCNSCHVLDEFGVDGEETSPGHDGTFGTRNSPTVYNAAMHVAQFWDGREPDVEAQAKGPLVNPIEHGMADAAAVEAVIKGIAKQELRGLEKFMEVGCTTCHMGPNLGGSIYQKVGVKKPYPTEDVGRFEVTGNEAEKFFFKVPALRNVAETAPYLHDGSVESLAEVVGIMVEYQLDAPLTPEETTDIVAFMTALTGNLPTEYIVEPALPQ